MWKETVTLWSVRKQTAMEVCLRFANAVAKSVKWTDCNAVTRDSATAILTFLVVFFDWSALPYTQKKI